MYLTQFSHLIVLLIFPYKFRTTAQEFTTLPNMTQTEMTLATDVTTVCLRLTLTKLTLTTMERVMPALLTLMVTVRGSVQIPSKLSLMPFLSLKRHLHSPKD